MAGGNSATLPELFAVNDQNKHFLDGQKSDANEFMYLYVQLDTPALVNECLWTVN
jgi:hypothetical protein